MKKLFLLILIVAAIGILGVYRGWFTISTDSDANKPNFSVSVDKDKIRQDKDKAVEKVETLEHEAKDKTATTQATPSSPD